MHKETKPYINYEATTIRSRENEIYLFDFNSIDSLIVKLEEINQTLSINGFTNISFCADYQKLKIYGERLETPEEVANRIKYDLDFYIKKIKNDIRSLEVQVSEEDAKIKKAEGQVYIVFPVEKAHKILERMKDEDPLGEKHQHLLRQYTALFQNNQNHFDSINKHKTLREKIQYQIKTKTDVLNELIKIKETYDN